MEGWRISTDEQQLQDRRHSSVLVEVSNTMVSLHKEQFGRGPGTARSGWTGDDTLVVTLHEALLPAEQALVEMGQIGRVQEARLFLSEATRARFIGAVESLTGREVRAFSSATDPRAETIWEIFEFKPVSG